MTRRNMILVIAWIGTAVPLVCQNQARPAQDHSISRASSSASQSTSTASTISPEQAASAAHAWFAALKAKDARRLAEQTRFPFTFDSTARKKRYRCEGIAADANQLATMIDCLARRDRLLLKELGYAEDLKVKV